jgi:hypothetical protein
MRLPPNRIQPTPVPRAADVCVASINLKKIKDILESSSSASVVTEIWLTPRVEFSDMITHE